VKGSEAKVSDNRRLRCLPRKIEPTPELWTVLSGHEHPKLVTTFGLATHRYRLNQLRYDLRKLRVHD
jgi:hypothetical protein